MIAMVSLTDGVTDSAPENHVEYQAVGFISDKAKDAVKLELPIHMTAVSGYFNDVVNRLTKKIAAMDETRGACIEKSIVGANVTSTSEGLVL